MAFGITVIGSAEWATNSFISPAYTQAAGHCIVVAIQSLGASLAATITDTAGNNANYVPVFSNNSNLGPATPSVGNGNVQLFYCKNCLGNAANIITVSQSTIGFSFATFYDISSADLTAPLDVSSKATATGHSATAATATFSTALANEIVIGIQGNEGGVPSGATGLGGYTIDGNETFFVGASEHQKFTSLQSGITASMTLGGTGFWVIASAGFKAAVHSISGNAGVAGATVSWTGTASGSTTADGSGNYTIPSLADGSYTITPSLAGYTFSPTNSAQTVSGADITGVNFTATASSSGGGGVGSLGLGVGLGPMSKWEMF